MAMTYSPVVADMDNLIRDGWKSFTRFEVLYKKNPGKKLGKIQSFRHMRADLAEWYRLGPDLCYVTAIVSIHVAEASTDPDIQISHAGIYT
jgi:hypothetical protein